MQDHSIEIRDEGDYRALFFGNDQLQSKMSLSDPEELVLSYTRYMAFPLLLQRSLSNILVIGIGSGSFIRFFNHHFPNCNIDAVDYSVDVIKVAKGYFMLPENDRITITCAEGFNFLKSCTEATYDIILVDAFDAKGMAPTIYSYDFFRLCSKRLAAEGVVSANLWSNDTRRLAEIKAVLSEIFQGKLYLPVPEKGNVVAVTFKSEVPWERLLQKNKKLHTLSIRYGINFRQLLKIAKQSNMRLTTRISKIFT